jgi:serine/threonine-protein kinase CTR1
MFFLLFYVAICQPNYRDYYSLNHQDNRVVIFGGHKNVTYYNDLWIYNLLNGTWSTYTTLLSKRTYTNMWKDELGKIYLWGGKEDIRIANDCWTIEEFEVTSFIFESTQPMERYGCIVLEHDNGIYVFGGIYSFTYTLYNDIWLYDSIHNNWLLLKGQNVRNSIFYNSDLPASRGLSIAWSISDIIYIYGGFNIKHLNDFWKFDLVNLEWELLSEYSIPGNQSCGCKFEINDNLFMFGMNGYLWNYSSSLDTWKILDNVTCLLYSFNYKNKIYSFNTSFNLIELYEIDLNQNITIDDDDTVFSDDTVVSDDDYDTINTIISIIIPVFILICFIIITLLIIIAFISFFFYKKNKKLKSIKDLDVILEEQKATKKFKIDFKINRSLFKVDYNSMTILKKIGSGGSNSVVFQCKYKNLDVAFKCFHINDWMEEEKFREFENELNIIANAHHPNILRFYGATFKEPRFGIVLEYCENGNIKEFLIVFKKNNGCSYPNKEKIRMLYEISISIQYLHELNPPVIHRDIKPENILITKNLQTRLMDFGISKVILNNTKTQTMKIGTPDFMAPEVVSSIDNKYNEKCDVFSFAIVIYCIMTENFYPYGRGKRGVELKVFANKDFRPDLNVCMPQWIKDLVVVLWDVDPSKRYSFRKITEIIKKLN